MSGQTENRPQRAALAPPSWVDRFGFVWSRLFEAIALSSIAPYLPLMVRMMGVPESETGFTVGLISTCFNIGNLMTTKLWTEFAESRGYKKTMLFCTTLVMASHILLGLSNTVVLACLARFLAGSVSGNAALARTVLGAVIVNKSYFYLIPATFFFGSLIGAPLASWVVNPTGRSIADDPTSNIFSRFPVLSSNLILLAPYALHLLFTFLFLKDVKDEKPQGDLGTALGYRVLNSARALIRLDPIEDPCPRLRDNSDVESSADERSPLLNSTESESMPEYQSSQPSEVPAPESTDLSRETVLILTLNTIQGFQGVSFAIMITVFLTSSLPDTIDFEKHWWNVFYIGGYGFKTEQLGVFYILNGVCSFFIQLFLYAKIVSRFSNLKIVRVITFASPITSLLIPFGVRLPGKMVPVSFIALLWLLHTTQDLFIFPLLHGLSMTSEKGKRSARVNVLATNWTTIGRISGSLFCGGLFYVGERIHMTSLPFFAAALLGIISIVISFMLDPKEVDNE